MLDVIFPWGGRVREFRSAEFVTCVATEPWQLAGYWRLRRDIFSGEQQLFAKSDRDEHDAFSVPIVALSQAAGMPDSVIGVVRVYQAGTGEWYGGRLGVHRLYRRHGVVGKRLIQKAVGTAIGLGCHRFLATVQAANVRYFERHHFAVIGKRRVCGRPHALMQAELPWFKPVLDGVAA